MWKSDEKRMNEEVVQEGEERLCICSCEGRLVCRGRWGEWEKYLTECEVAAAMEPL